LIDDEVWLRPRFVNLRTTEEGALDVVAIATGRPTPFLLIPG